jgi:hypothetical protein
MSDVTIEFTLEEEQLERVDRLASLLNSDFASMLDLIIEVGVPLVEAWHRQQMEWLVRYLEAGIREGRVPPPQGLPR